MFSYCWRWCIFIAIQRWMNRIFLKELYGQQQQRQQKWSQVRKKSSPFYNRNSKEFIQSLYVICILIYICYCLFFVFMTISIVFCFRLSFRESSNLSQSPDTIFFLLWFYVVLFERNNNNNDKKEKNNNKNDRTLWYIN